MASTVARDRLALDQVRAGFQVYIWCAKCQAFTLPLGVLVCDEGHYGKGLRA